MCAAITGKIDAMVFVGGALIGVFIYAFTYEPIWEALRNSGAMGEVNIADWIGIDSGLFILILTFIAASAFVAVTIIQKKITSKRDYQL